MPSVGQDWVNDLSYMQQSVLFAAIRGCDGLTKEHLCKPLIRWYRRCILLSAFDGRALTNAFDPGGGSFTGPIHPDRITPSESQQRYWLDKVADDFLEARDELPLHYWLHCMHAFEIIGYKHPLSDIRAYWSELYARMVTVMHLYPEPEFSMDQRLCDNKEKWEARNDRSEIKI